MLDSARPGILMVGADAALLELIALREGHAIEALTTPKGKTEFDYGEAVGFNRGLTTAIQLVSGLLEKEDKDSEAEPKILDGNEEDDE